MPASPIQGSSARTAKEGVQRNGSPARNGSLTRVNTIKPALAAEDLGLVQRQGKKVVLSLKRQ